MRPTLLCVALLSVLLLPRADLTDCFYDSSAPDNNFAVGAVTHLGNNFKFYHDSGRVQYTGVYNPMMGGSTYTFDNSRSVIQADQFNPGIPFQVSVVHVLYWLWAGEPEEFAHLIGSKGTGPINLNPGQLMIIVQQWDGLQHFRQNNSYDYYKATMSGVTAPFSAWLRTPQLNTGL